MQAGGRSRIALAGSGGLDPRVELELAGSRQIAGGRALAAHRHVDRTNGHQHRATTG